MKYTPFDKEFDKEGYDYLEASGLSITTNKSEAHLFIGYDGRKVKKFVLRNPFKKPVLIWTNEPRLSQVKAHSYRPYALLPMVHLMNVYTGDVFINNITYQRKRFTNNQKLELLAEDFQLENRTLAALMSYYNAGLKSALYIEGINVDLVRKRSEIGIYGHENNLADIYGRGWPDGMSKEDSRSGGWTDRKSVLLKPYNFNLCFENTVAPNYITEKIWDSIENHCLPIYYGGLNSTIYEIFPKDSFLDYAKFENPKDLFDHISSMTDKEFVNRMNKCISVYNEYVEKPLEFWRDNHKIVLDNIISKCRNITA